MPNMTIQPFTGLQNPQQPLGGLLTGGFSPYAQASPTASAAPQSGLLSNMGPWSQLAYQMAGSPKQGGPYAQVATPAAPAGSSSSSSGSGVGSTLGGILGGLLNVAAKNPSLLKSAYNGVSGLLGGGAADGSISSILAGGSPTLSAVGTGAVAPAVDSAAADASAALADVPATAGAEAAGGLLGAGAGSGAIGAAGANALGASGGFATGGAAGAAGGSGAAAGAALSPAATAALVAAPFIAQQAALALGNAWTAKNTQGNAAMKGWMQATGSKWVPNPGQSNSGGNTFQSQQFSSASNPGTMYGPDGKPMTGAQAANAIYQWATQNGVNPGDFHP